MNNAIGLYRCSTQAQADSDLGLASQRAEVRAFAERRGLHLVAEYTDAGVSGGAALEKREGLVAALAQLGRGDVLLVKSYDRLARDLMLQLTIEKAVSKKGAKIIAVSNEGASADGPSDVLLRRLLSSVAEYEKAIIGARCAAAAKSLKAQGRVAGHPEYGFSVGPDNQAVENAEELAVIERVKQLRNPSSKQPWRVVAETLNDEGFTNRSGNAWSLHNLYSCLNGRV